MTTPNGQSYWSNMGMSTDVFSNNLGLGSYRDDEEFHRGIFDAFDRNKNGFIDQSELALVLRQVGKNVSAADLQAMLNEADLNTDGQISYSEFQSLCSKINSGNWTSSANVQVSYATPAPVVDYQVQTTTLEVGPGRPNPPNINMDDLVVRGAFQRRGVDGDAFHGHINSLRAIDGADSAKQSELLVGLRGKVAGCSGSIDLRGHLGQVSGHMNATRSEHGSLLQQNQALVAHNNKLIGYIKEFESRQSGWLSRIAFLEEERKAMEQYISRINKENKVLKVSIQERDVEINRLNSLLPQIQEWKQKYEVSQAENQRLQFVIGDLNQQIIVQRQNIQERDVEILRLNALLPQIQEWKQKWEVSQAENQRLQYVINDLNQQIIIQRDNYELQIRDLRAELQVYSRKLSEMEIIMESKNMDWSVLMNQATSGRANHEKLGQFVAGEHLSMKQRIEREHSSMKERIEGEHANMGVRLNNMIANSLQESLSAKQTSREIQDAEIRQRVTNNTISYFGKGEGTAVVFDKAAARECLSQILTNAYGQPYGEVQAQLAANFESQWAQVSKNSNGTLSQAQYSNFFNNALSATLQRQ